MKSNELSNTEYSTFNATYISVVNSSLDLIEGFENSIEEFILFLEQLPVEKLEYRYADGKWTIKDIIQHIIDAERIFSYRALRISRNDKTPLAGFDENEYVENTNANARNFKDLLSELKLVRQTTVMLFKSFSKEQMLILGTASNHSVSVRAIGFVILGHQLHHYKVIQERYL
jgi:uncharacterized damage-inducible protein DinB